MSLELTLNKINDDISQGNLGKARDRLHSLISTFPNELSLRDKLADVYLKLQNPAMAGRYAYLNENKTAELQNAIVVFEKECGSKALNKFLAIKFKGNLKLLNDSFASKIIIDLQDEIKRENRLRINLVDKDRDKYEYQSTTFDLFLPYIFIAIVLSALFFMIIGIRSALKTLISFILDSF